MPISLLAKPAHAILWAGISAASLSLVQPALADDPIWEEFSDDPYPLARISEDAGRYPKAAPKSLRVHQHGEIENLGDAVSGTHWFVDADQIDGGPVWHFVTAGDPADDVILMIHRYRDIRWANAEVMALLADEYYVIAVDVLGYGQSDEGPDIDVSDAAAAASLTNLRETTGVDAFDLTGDDRSSVVSENLLAQDGMSDRISAFVRMPQSFDQPHGLPRPPHAAMSTVPFQSQACLARVVYTSNYGSVHFPERFFTAVGLGVQL